MKKKITRIWGVGLVVVLLVSMLAFAAPASAGTLEYSKIPTPAPVHNQIKANSDASFIKVASDGTIFAVDTQPVGNDVVYKSTNGGFSWTASTALGFDCADLELSPDYANDNTLFALKGTMDAVQVYISTDGGAKFNPLGGSIATSGNITGTDLAVSPMYSSGSGEIMVATSDNDSTQYGDVYLWGATGVLNWVAQSLNQDVTTVEFSPNYPIDATYLAISSNSTDTYLNTKVSTNAWNSLAGYPVDLTPTGITAVTEAEITGSAIAFASDWNGSIPTLQRSFVALRSSNSDDDVRRVTGTSSVAGLAPEGGGDQEYVSLAYTGDYNTGTLFAGADTAQVRRCANPTQPSPAWYAATKAPTGATNTYIALDPDFATNNKLWAGTEGTESAVSVSADGGVNFDQTGLIDTTVNAINHVALADANTYFMTTSTGDGGVESLWKKAGPDWVRINAEFDTTSEDAGVVLSPNYATDSTLYYYDIGGTTIRMSTDGGASFSNRIAPSAIAALMPTDGYTLYLGTGINVRKSGNGGWTWGPPKATTVGGAVNMLTWDSATGHLFAGGTTGKISQSTDGGNTWADVGGSGPAGGGGAVIVAVDPNYAENNTVYANDAAVAGIWRNVVGPGSTWQQIDAGTVTMPAAKCVGLTLDANGVMYAADSTAAAAGAGGIMRSLDPRKPFGPPVNGTWEVSSTDDMLAANSTLAGIALTSGSNQIVVIENSGTDQLLGFTDTIVGVAPALVSPEDGAISTGAGSIQIAWEQVAGAKSYKYETDTRADFKSAASNTTNDPVTNATVSNLQEGKTYYWRVRVETPVIGPWSESRTITTQITSVANAPAITSPARGGTGSGGYDAPLQPLFQWSSLKWATGYEFQLAKDPNFNDIVVNKTGADALGATTVYQPVTKLDYNTTYYWRVRGIGASTETDWSPVTGFTTMAEPVEPAPPVVVEEVPPPVIEIPPAQPPPQINIPPAPEAPAPIAPAYIWAVIVIGAILVIAVIVLIVRTRRSV